MDKPFCIKCDKARLPSSSNARFEFDYCSHCKQMSTFAAQPSQGGAAVPGANLQKAVHKQK